MKNGKYTRKRKMYNNEIKIIVIGVSAGGAEALRQVLPALPADFPVPVVIVQHLHPEQGGYMFEYFDKLCKLAVQEAIDKADIKPGNIYFAPPDYHLLIEDDKTFSLSVDEKVCYARPSIDVLFESAADVYGSELMAVILTGANSDGANGIKYIKERGGFTIAQSPAEAYSSTMPQSAIDTGKIDMVLTLNEISNTLTKATKSTKKAR